MTIAGLFRYPPVMMTIWICRGFAASVLLLAVVGCHTAAPMHVWTAPELTSAVGHRVGIGEVSGPDALAQSIRSKMLAMHPSDAGRNLAAVDLNQLVKQRPIQLTSATQVLPEVRHLASADDASAVRLASSDLESTAIARQTGLDYVLRGDIVSRIQRPGTSPVERETAPFDPQKKLAVSWKLYNVKDNQPVGGKPVVVDGVTAGRLHPDLAGAADPDEGLVTALVRESYRLIAPSTQRQTVQLAVPYLMPGSRETRQANALAIAGRWGEAAVIWQEVVDRHPTQSAALHNLALAAAAGQDFSRAKSLARRAIRLFPSPLGKTNLIWIEQRQRDYHKAFDLDDPPEGWFLVRTDDRSPKDGGSASQN